MKDHYKVIKKQCLMVFYGVNGEMDKTLRVY